MLTPWAVHLFRSPFKVKPPFTQVNFEIKHDYRILAPKSSSCVLTLRFFFHLFVWDETSNYTETEDLSIAVVVAFYLVVCVCWCRCVAAIVHGAWSVEYHPAYDCWCCRSTDETTHFMCRKFWTSMDCSFFSEFSLFGDFPCRCAHKTTRMMIGCDYFRYSFVVFYFISLYIHVRRKNTYIYLPIHTTRNNQIIKINFNGQDAAALQMHTNIISLHSRTVSFFFFEKTNWNCVTCESQSMKSVMLVTHSRYK